MTDSRQPRDEEVRKRVIEPDRSFAVQAPAGSGKTELLSRRFLRLLAVVEKPQQVLAITFTRKATREMLDRVLDRLRSARLGVEPAEAHERAAFELARAVLDQDQRFDWGLLEDPAQLQIHTIDGFCARLAMRAPDQPLAVSNLLVAEYPEPAYREAARRALEAAAGAPAASPVREAFEALLLRERGNANALETLLADMLPRRDQWLGDVNRTEDLGRALMAERQQVELAALEGALGADRLAEASEAVYRLAQLAESGSVADEVIRAWESLGPGASPATIAEACWRTLEPLGTASRDLMSPRSINSKVFPGAASGRSPWVDGLKDVVDGWYQSEQAKAAYKRFVQTPPLDLVPGNATLLKQLRELLRLACDRLEVTFADRGLCDFQHVAQQAVTALGDELAPSEALLIEDGRLAHVLIDEFQDTSQLQYDLVRKLVSGWTPGDGRTLFLVGDPMQSIYGFRKANVGLFRTVMEEARLGDVPLEPRRLEVNFRSTRPVIEDVNRTCARLFQASSEASPGHVAYQAVEAFRGEGGEVTTRAFLAGESMELARRAEARWIAEDIASLDRDPEIQTVGVLARTRAQLEPVARALMERGIPFEAVEVTSLHQRPRVLELLTLTRAFLHPGDRVAWVALLVAPWCALQPGELLALLGDRNSADVLVRCEDAERLAHLSPASRERVSALAEILRCDERRAGLRPLAERVEAAWVALGGPRLVSSPEELEDVERFLALLSRLDEEMPEDLLAELERRLPKLFAASRSAPVKLMTIHKAKGLEFDAVYLPALQARPRQGDRSLFRQFEMRVQGDEHASLLAPVQASGERLPSGYDYLGLLERDAQTSEAQRLLYVAMTRARRLLRLSAVVRAKKDGGLAREAGSFLTLLHERFEPLLPEAQPAPDIEMQAPEPWPLFRLQRADPALPIVNGDDDSPGEEGAENAALGDSWPARDRLALGEALHHWFEIIHDDWRDHGGERWQGEWFEDYAPALRSSLRRAGAAEADLDCLQEQLVGLLRERLADPDFLAMLSPENKLDSRAEAEYLVPEGDRLKRRIIDRLYRDAEGQWHIVDYKTGSDSPATRESWSGQLAGYRAAVEAAEEGQVVEASILTAEDGRFIDPAGARST
ncbi:MAG: UvrD-helicase domain-containing protein [Xanthomonadales bacterium]|jgi:ATP-dependent exoDNAse (exonuclease V) beta subunit|nr:UvrD-helicase domain-containing protein [Xanthomonadales bacterium]